MTALIINQAAEKESFYKIGQPAIALAKLQSPEQQGEIGFPLLQLLPISLRCCANLQYVTLCVCKKMTASLSCGHHQYNQQGSCVKYMVQFSSNGLMRSSSIYTHQLQQMGVIKRGLKYERKSI